MPFRVYYLAENLGTDKCIAEKTTEAETMLKGLTGLLGSTQFERFAQTREVMARDLIHQEVIGTYESQHGPIPSHAVIAYGNFLNYTPKIELGNCACIDDMFAQIQMKPLQKF